MANRVGLTLALSFLLVLHDINTSLSHSTDHHPQQAPSTWYSRTTYNSRKMLMELVNSRRAKEVMQPEHDSMMIRAGEVAVAESQLRKVPSGPDPMHHNGSGPKEPKTTP
ncbi:hypothetical protein Droror1_Dr00004152 [Drosera rotundifolia]